MARPSSKVRVRIRPERLIGPLGDRMEQNMRMAVEFVRNEVVKDLNRGQPVKIYPSGAIRGLEPSLPGEPPKKVTGFLQNSIRTRVERTFRRISGFVGTNTNYARALELGSPKTGLAPRPYLRPAIARNRRTIFRIIAGGKRGLPEASK